MAKQKENVVVVKTVTTLLHPWQEATSGVVGYEGTVADEVEAKEPITVKRERIRIGKE